MLTTLRFICVILVTLVLVPVAAHALELPGKLRLAKEAYVTVQSIYYPGFTLIGMAEPIAVFATASLLAATPPGTAGFWLTLTALIALGAMHAVFWLTTQPVNRVWLENMKLGAAGSRFFGKAHDSGESRDWTQLRDRWEHSHVLRATLTLVAFLALQILLSFDL